MDGSMSKGRRLQFLTVALVALLLPLGWYYFVYVSSEKVSLIDRNFRLLGRTSQQIQARIEYLSLSWVQMTEEFSKDVEERPTETLENFRKGAQRRATELINLIAGLEKNSTKVEFKKIANPEDKAQDRNAVPSLTVERKRDTVTAYFYYQYPNPIRFMDEEIFRISSMDSDQLRDKQPVPDALLQGFKRHGISLSDPEVTVVDKTQDGAWLITDTDTRKQYRITRQLSQLTIYNYNQYVVHITARSDLSSLLMPIVQQPEFDDVLVVGHKDEPYDKTKPKDGGQLDGGAVIFQRELGGIQVLTLALPVEKTQQGGENKENWSNRLVEIELGGAHYQAFLQPLQLSFVTGQKIEKRKWLVCGLVRADRFLSESLLIPTPVLFGFLFLILAATFTWPFLNLWFLGLRERLSVSDVLFLAFSLLIGSALFPLLLLDGYAYWGLATTRDQQLKNFADNLHEHFQTELDNIDQQLMAISTDPPQRSSQLDLSFQATSILSLGDLQYDISSSVEMRGGMDKATFWIPQKSYADSPYPYFDSVFWIDSEGAQRSKWAVQTQATPLINVYDRDYFRSIFQCWSRVRRRDGKTVHFYVDPIYSWNTGENLTVYSVPMEEPSDFSLTCPSASYRGSVKPAVAALVTRPLSLIQPVIPPGFGYAVFTDDGSVSFHSDYRRNLQENFFAESRHNDRLRSVVFGHSSELIDAQYRGKPHRLYVRPINDLPWFLVVYRDQELLNTANLELLSVALMLLLAYLSLLIVFLLLYLWLSADRLRWLWPAPERTKAYWLFGMTNLVLGLTLWMEVGLVTSGPWFLVVAMMLAPVLEVVFFYFIIFRKGFTSDSRKRDSFWFRFGYVFAIASIFLPLSVFPALAFFKVAYQEEMALVVKHGQLQLARAIEKRERRITDQYFSVQIDEKEQFLAKRLELQRGWRYLENILPRVQKPAFIQALTDKQLLDSITWTPLPENALDIYTTFFFDTRVFSFVPPEETNHKHGSGFEWVLSQIRPLYSEASIELHGVQGPGSANHSGPDLADTLSWRWERIGLRGEQLQFKKERGEDNRSLLLVSTIPDFEWPTGAFERSGLLLGSVFLVVLLYLSVRIIAQRVFLRDFLEPPNPGQAALKELSRNVLLLGPPFSGKSELLHKQEGFCVVDLHKQWQKKTVTYQNVEQEVHKVIALDHFEYQLGVPEQDYAKLQLLEELLFTYKKPVVIASTIDPVEFYCVGPVGRDGEVSTAFTHEQNKDSWAEIFSSFWNVYIGDEGDPEAFAEELSRQKAKILSENAHFFASQRADKRLSKLFCLVERECCPTAYLQEVGKQIVKEPTFAHLTSRELNEVIWDQACVYYQIVWSTCSTSEQFLLIRLAQDRFVNARNPDLPRLLKRRLVVRDPDLRLMNASFERFVESVTPSREVLVWEEKAKTSGWNALKGPLLVVLIGVGFFLYTTQPDLFNATTAFASAAAAGGMPALFKLFATFAQEDKTKQ
jgi:hypothetical protein